MTRRGAARGRAFVVYATASAQAAVLTSCYLIGDPGLNELSVEWVDGVIVLQYAACDRGYPRPQSVFINTPSEDDDLQKIWEASDYLSGPSSPSRIRLAAENWEVATGSYEELLGTVALDVTIEFGAQISPVVATIPDGILPSPMLYYQGEPTTSEKFNEAEC